MPDMYWDKNNYQVVFCDDIVIYGINENDFWGYKSREKEEYEELVRGSQEFFDAFELGNDTENYKFANEELEYLYMGKKAVVVRTDENGKLVCVEGRHRCAIAKEYGLKMLVFFEKQKA